MRENMMSEVKRVKVLILIIYSQLLYYIYASSSESDESDDNDESKITVVRPINDELYE